MTLNGTKRAAIVAITANLILAGCDDRPRQFNIGEVVRTKIGRYEGQITKQLNGFKGPGEKLSRPGISDTNRNTFRS